MKMLPRIARLLDLVAVEWKWPIAGGGYMQSVDAWSQDRLASDQRASATISSVFSVHDLAVVVEGHDHVVVGGSAISSKVVPAPRAADVLGREDHAFKFSERRDWRRGTPPSRPGALVEHEVVVTRHPERSAQA